MHVVVVICFLVCSRQSLDYGGGPAALALADFVGVVLVKEL
jgi:hypothetical protein